MADREDQREQVHPSEQRGGSTPSEEEARAKRPVGGEGRRGRGPPPIWAVRMRPARCCPTIPSWQLGAARRPAPTSRPPRPASIPPAATTRMRPRTAGPSAGPSAEPDLRDAASGRARSTGVRRPTGPGRLTALSGAVLVAAARLPGSRERSAIVAAMADSIRIVVLEGDETGQELLEQALRVLDPDLLRIDLELQRFDLSLERRRATGNQVVIDAAAAMRETGLGLKAATITPEGADDVGSPNRILREAGRRQGDRPHRPPAARASRRSPASTTRSRWSGWPSSDAYGAEQWREGDAGSADEVAFRTERDHPLDLPRGGRVRVPHRASDAARACTAGPKWTVSPVYEGMLKEEMDAAAARHPDVAYQPVLIDATYAGLLSGATDAPLVIPALNRDGDCLSDLVLPMFGSIAGAESVLLAFDENYETTVAMAEAPHGTAPALAGQGHRQPAGDDPGLRRGAAPRRRAPRRRGRARLPGDLRGRARDRRRGHQDAGPRRPRRHHRVHRRGDRARPRRSSTSGPRWAPRPEPVPSEPRSTLRTYVPVFRSACAPG